MHDPVHPASVRNPAGFWDISPGAAASTLSAFRLVDVRQPEEYTGVDLHHIAGAQNVPLATVPATVASWDRGEPVLLICRSGGRSANAGRFMAEMGFARVYNLVGGMLAWNAQGLPVEK